MAVYFSPVSWNGLIVLILLIFGAGIGFFLRNNLRASLMFILIGIILCGIWWFFYRRDFYKWGNRHLVNK